jgi:hypothetical protein
MQLRCGVLSGKHSLLVEQQEEQAIQASSSGNKPLGCSGCVCMKLGHGLERKNINAETRRAMLFV